MELKTKVDVSQDLKAPKDEVWRVVGDFNGLPEWHPGVAGSRIAKDGSKTQRTLALQNGGVIVEQLATEDTFAYEYEIVDGPLPVINYRARLEIADAPGGCRVRWSSAFDPPEGVSENDAAAVIRGIYQAGFDSLRERFGGS